MAAPFSWRHCHKPPAHAEVSFVTSEAPRAKGPPCDNLESRHTKGPAWTSSKRSRRTQRQARRRCSTVPRPPSERRAAGLAAREACPIETLGAWEPRASSEPAIALIEQQSVTRDPSLVPLRYERMGVSPFTFYRGSAVIMAADLATMPVTGIEVQCIGDAHVGNFGIFMSHTRHLVFDVNDFDETAPGPWEWDVIRLVASIEICGRDRGFSRPTAATPCAPAPSSTAARWSTLRRGASSTSGTPTSTWSACSTSLSSTARPGGPSARSWRRRARRTACAADRLTVRDGDACALTPVRPSWCRSRRSPPSRATTPPSSATRCAVF